MQQQYNCGEQPKVGIQGYSSLIPTNSNDGRKSSKYPAPLQFGNAVEKTDKLSDVQGHSLTGDLIYNKMIPNQAGIVIKSHPVAVFLFVIPTGWMPTFGRSGVVAMGRTCSIFLMRGTSR